MRRWLAILLSVIFLVSGIHTVFAHANLIRSDPPANTSLEAAPSEIRLWFTESLESEFSRFTIRDGTGAVVASPPSQVDTADPTQLFMQTGELPEGLYTVSWRVLSTDGHTTEGSFVFGIRAAVTGSINPTTINETIPADSALIRWINLVSLSLGVGSLAFWLFVWRPAVPQRQPDVERWMRWVIWLGWGLLGVSGILMLLLQVSIAAGISLSDALIDPALVTVLTNSRYGQIWLVRLILWLVLGVVVWFAQHNYRFYGIGLILGGLILLTNSLYSHAGAMQENTLAAVAGDWLHLAATALWVGGLIQFIVVLSAAKRYFGQAIPMLSNMVGHFSNFARVTVAGLMISGFYAAWLQVGSVEALSTTLYGQTLLIKLLVVIPLLLISAVNLVFTQQGLRRGEHIWAGRLRSLVGAEIILTLAILAAVGVMTAIAPARKVVAERNAAALTSNAQPYSNMQTTENLMAHLEITPGTVGENAFVITLYDGGGNPVTDATRIRLLFDHTEQNLGQSELRPELQPDGSYTVTGANLGITGTWRIRMIVQRAEQFDALIDFRPEISPVALPVSPEMNAAIPLTSQWIAMLITGLALLTVGGFFAGRTKLYPLNMLSLPTLTIVVIGLVFLILAAGNMTAAAASGSGELSVRNPWTRPLSVGMTGGIYMTIKNTTNLDDRLIGAITDAAESVEIHQTQMENDVARMRPLAGLDIPAGSSVTVLPGQYHLMLVNLQRNLSSGDSITAVLQFESGKELTVAVPVR